MPRTFCWGAGEWPGFWGSDLPRRDRPGAWYRLPGFHGSRMSKSRFIVWNANGANAFRVLTISRLAGQSRCPVDDGMRSDIETTARINCAEASVRFDEKYAALEAL